MNANYKSNIVTKWLWRGFSALFILAFVTSVFAQTPSLRTNGKIAFVSQRDGNPEIYLVNPDSSNVVRLTNNRVVDDAPTWSPDGTRIAFLSQRDDGFLVHNGFSIFTMNADGSNRTEVTALTTRFLDFVWQPLRLSWSPDGKKIAFGDSGDIFVVNVDGSGRQNLTPDPTVGGLTPVWSPDGSKILFSSGTLHTINVDGTNLTPLVNGGVYGESPDWSAAANKIVYSVGGDVWQIHIANPDGTGRQFFHGCDWFDYSCGWDPFTPTFSPDGTKIAFTKVIWVNNSTYQVYVKNLDGTGLTLVTEGKSPAWQPLLPAEGPNPIDRPDFFISQQYRDFLGREPDSNGFANWMATLEGCANGGFGEFENPHCDRVHVSAGFVQSHEFQGRGYWILRFGYVGLNRSIGSVRSSATYAEFTPALAQVGGSNSPAQEETAKVAYTNAFVQRADFLALFPATMTASQYVNALESNAQVTLSNKQALIDALNGGTITRADVLRNVVESQVVFDKYLIPAFVTMEYFGYLRRDPDLIGYQNWVNTLTANPNDYRHMIFGFIYSTEYRQRFGPA